MDSSKLEFSINEAARECGIHRNTVKRRLAAGEFSDAVKRDGAWRIPLPNLLAAGLQPGKPTPPETPTVDLTEEDAEVVRVSRKEWVQLQSDLRVVEALLGEREARLAENAQSLESLRLALRQLGASREVEPVKPKRRGWFRTG